MAKNYKDMEEFKINGGEPLTNRNQKEGKQTSMSGYNIQDKYGQKREKLPSSMGEKEYQSQLEQRDANQALDNREGHSTIEDTGMNPDRMHQLEVEQSREDSAGYQDGGHQQTDGQSDRGRPAENPDRRKQLQGDQSRDDPNRNQDSEFQQTGRQTFQDNTTTNPDRELQQQLEQTFTDGSLPNRELPHQDREHQRDSPMSEP